MQSLGNVKYIAMVNKFIFIIVNIVLSIVCATVAWLWSQSLNTPINFEHIYDTRKEAIVDRLKDIRKAQKAYYSVYERYSGSFDSLIYFLKNDSLVDVLREGELTDEHLEQGITEKEAIRRGIIIRKEIRRSVLKNIDFSSCSDPDSLPIIPYGNGANFLMQAGVIVTGGGLQIPVFEVGVHNNTFLSDADEQSRINLNETARKLNRYPGLKIGSIKEITNHTGNWE